MYVYMYIDICIVNHMYTYALASAKIRDGLDAEAGVTEELAPKRRSTGVQVPGAAFFFQSTNRLSKNDCCLACALAFGSLVSFRLSSSSSSRPQYLKRVSAPSSDRCESAPRLTSRPTPPHPPLGVKEASEPTAGKSNCKDMQ